MTLRLQTRLFASRADAAAAAHDLGIAGFQQDEVALISDSNGLPGTAGPRGEASTMMDALIAAGLAEHQAQGMAHQLRQGGTLVVVRCDDARSERAGTILAHHLATHELGQTGVGASAEDSGILSAPAPGTPGNPPSQ